MTSLLDLHAKYEAVQKELEATEAKAAGLRKEKAAIAEDILTEHGPGPHDIGGKKLIVSKARGGTSFLREPPPLKAKKS
jgi:hypothetical protein